MRRRARDIRWRSTPTRENLTRDVVDATLYHQVWRHRDGVMLTSFDVLCCRPDDAEDCGRYRLSGPLHLDATGMVLVSSTAQDASVARKLAVVEVEDPEEREIRVRQWTRDENGPDDDSRHGGVGMAELMDRAYETHRGQR